MNICAGDEYRGGGCDTGMLTHLKPMWLKHKTWQRQQTKTMNMINPFLKLTNMKSHPIHLFHHTKVRVPLQYSTKHWTVFFSLCWINIIKKQKKKLWIIVFNIQKLPITQYEVFIIEVYNELSRVTLLSSSSVVCVSSVDISLVPMFQFYMGDLSTICTQIYISRHARETVSNTTKLININMIILLPITDHHNILENVENITFGFSGFHIWIFTLSGTNMLFVICSKLMGDPSVR